MKNKKTTFYVEGVQCQIYAHSFPSKGDISYLYTDESGKQTDARKKRQWLARGVLTNKGCEIDLDFCVANWNDIERLFDSFENFLEYAREYWKKYFIRNGVEWDELRLYQALFDSDEEYRSAVKIYKELLLARSIRRTINRIFELARSNRWEYFATFTFSPQVVERKNYHLCAKKFSQWLNNLRKNNPDLKYLAVPEMHKDGAWHFHSLLADCKNMQFIFSGHYTKDGELVYNCAQYKFGWTTATAISVPKRAVSYLCKYLSKDLCQVAKNKKRFWASRNLNKPVVLEVLEEGSYCERLLKVASEMPVEYVKTIHSPFGKIGIIESSLNQEERENDRN